MAYNGEWALTKTSRSRDELLEPMPNFNYQNSRIKNKDDELPTPPTTFGYVVLGFRTLFLHIRLVRRVRHFCVFYTTGNGTVDGDWRFFFFYSSFLITNKCIYLTFLSTTYTYPLSKPILAGPPLLRTSLLLLPSNLLPTPIHFRHRYSQDRPYCVLPCCCCLQSARDRHFNPTKARIRTSCRCFVQKVTSMH
jgi:hypothetical protein